MNMALVDVVVYDILTPEMKDDDLISYAEIDSRFFDSLDDIGMDEEEQEFVIGAWLKFTDHENPSRMKPMTALEWAALERTFRRLIRHHKGDEWLAAFLDETTEE